MYLADVIDNKLTYRSGVLIADPWWPAFSLSSDGKKLRFAYVFGENGVQLQDLDLESTAEADRLAKNPAQALDEWQKKLGLSVSDLGRIGKLWDNEQPSISDQTYQAKRAAR
jgi:hypothetical protein